MRLVNSLILSSLSAPLFKRFCASQLVANSSFSVSASVSGDSVTSSMMEIDPEYPGTAVQRMKAIRDRVLSLIPEQLNGDWQVVRRHILWAGGLKDLPTSQPGLGYTGHSFNDFNHCDLTAMLGEVAHNQNEGQVTGIQFSNRLGRGIEIASLPELGPGGSWSTCMIGCNHEPPKDVAHLQFRSRIAFKLVWAAPDFTSFVLVDDAGELLNQVPARSPQIYSFGAVFIYNCLTSFRADRRELCQKSASVGRTTACAKDPNTPRLQIDSLAWRIKIKCAAA